jgi:hypothetical protein
VQGAHSDRDLDALQRVVGPAEGLADLAVSGRQTHPKLPPEHTATSLAISGFPAGLNLGGGGGGGSLGYIQSNNAITGTLTASPAIVVVPDP